MVERSQGMYRIHISCEGVDAVYSCGSVAPEELLKYSLSVFGAGDRVSNGPLVSEDLVVIAALRTGQ